MSTGRIDGPNGINNNIKIQLNPVSEQPTKINSTFGDGFRIGSNDAAPFYAKWDEVIVNGSGYKYIARNTDFISQQDYASIGVRSDALLNVEEKIYG